MFTKQLSRDEEREAKEEFIESFRDGFDHTGYDLEHCCGVLQVGGWNDFNDSDLIKYKRAIVQEFKGDFMDNWRSYGVVLTTINHHQICSVVPILKALGFTFASKGVNLKHGNTVYVWTKVINKSTRSHLPPKKK